MQHMLLVMTWCVCVRIVISSIDCSASSHVTRARTHISAVISREAEVILINI
jgi:hypothetical protein